MIIGLVELQNRLRKLSQEVPGVVASALYDEGKIEMTEAKRRTPVLTGDLRDSGTVYKPNIDSKGEISVKMSFGVPEPSYAIFVHENLEVIHINGQAKFLESTLLESAPYIAARVARRINFNRWGI